MTADSQTQDEVLAALQRMTDAYQKRDLEAVMATFGSDPDVMLFGTGADEVRRGKDAIRTQVQRDWSQSDEVSVRPTGRGDAHSGTPAFPRSSP